MSAKFFRDRLNLPCGEHFGRTSPPTSTPAPVRATRDAINSTDCSATRGTQPHKSCGAVIPVGETLLVEDHSVSVQHPFPAADIASRLLDRCRVNLYPLES